VIVKNDSLIDNIIQTVKPNNDMLIAMKNTTLEINKLKDSFESLNSQLSQLKKEEIERAVRNEIERIFTDKISK